MFNLFVLRLLALGLELPEETFVNMHGLDAVGETYGETLGYCHVHGVSMIREKV